jgi:hypothetical protein
VTIGEDIRGRTLAFPYLFGLPLLFCLVLLGFGFGFVLFLCLELTMDPKILMFGLVALFTVTTLFFGTRNGFYDSDNYHGNGSAH